MAKTTLTTMVIASGSTREKIIAAKGKRIADLEATLRDIAELVPVGS